jgi:hypothetical protein
MTAAETAQFDPAQRSVDFDQDQPGGISQSRVDLAPYRIGICMTSLVELSQLVDTEGSSLLEHLRRLGNEPRGQGT